MRARNTGRGVLGKFSQINRILEYAGIVLDHIDKTPLEN